jgi:hypothetical protein
MARYSSRVRVQRTRLIDAPLATVYAQVADLQHWAAWNPWLADGVRPTLSLPANAQGSRWAWDAGRAGQGMVEHASLQDPARISQRVHLHHPFAVHGTNSWEFVDREGRTEVRWSLRARVQFSARAFAPTIQQSLALDLRYGLDRLAQSVEPMDAPHYAIRHMGVQEVAECRYVYQTYEGPIAGLPAAVTRITESLRQQLKAQGVSPSGAPLAAYVKTNIKLRTTMCHIGIPVADADVGALPVRELPAHTAYSVQLQGDRSALEVAWYLAMQRMVAQDIKPDQRTAPVEHYFDGDGTAELTELHLPVLRP